MKDKLRHLCSVNVWLLILSVVSLVNLLVRFRRIPAGVSLRIECAKLILEGKVPYVDFFVLDSPVALFLSTLPVKFASLLRLEGCNIRCTLVFEWICSAVMLALCAALIMRRERLKKSLWCHTMLLTIAVMNIGCVFQFGQPEHYLMTGITPYLIARWLEYSGQKLNAWESIMSGAIGGVVILLDPYFLVVPFAIEFGFLAYFMRFSVRRNSPLFILALSASLLSALIAFGFQPMMNNYTSYILPMIMADRQTFDMRLYGLHSCPDFRIFVYMMLLSSILVLAVRNKNSLITPLVILSWLGFAYVLAECKGYFYQALPMFWTASLACTIFGAFILKDLCRWSRHKPWLKLRTPVVVSFLTAAAAGTFLLLEQKAQDLVNTARHDAIESGCRDILDFADVVRRESSNSDRLLVLNNNIAPAYPVMTLQNRTPGSRIMWSYFIPILERMKEIRSIPPSEIERLSKFYYGILQEDLEFNPPDLLLIEAGMSWEALNKHGLTKTLDANFIQVGEALYYSVNLPPAEYSNPNYVLSVFKHRLPVFR